MKSPEHLLNPGDRPSRLDVARLHCGEITGEEADRLRALVESHPQARAWWDELEQARGQAPPFDPEVLQKAAFRIQEEEGRRTRARVRPAVSPLWRWLGLGGALAAAALALVVALPDPGNRAKGEADIDFYVLRDSQVYPGSEGEVHVAGDRIQFTYRSTEASTLVLVSLDGNGTFNQYYPPVGQEPVAITPGERRVLPDSIELDDAPDFEIFLAWFGASSVGDVQDQVLSTWDAEGLPGLVRLAEEDPEIDAIYVRKPSSPFGVQP